MSPTTICSPSVTGRARLRLSVRTPGRAPPAASSASTTREPAGSTAMPGRRTLPTTSTTTSPVGPPTVAAPVPAAVPVPGAAWPPVEADPGVAVSGSSGAPDVSLATPGAVRTGASVGAVSTDPRMVCQAPTARLTATRSTTIARWAAPNCRPPPLERSASHKPHRSRHDRRGSACRPAPRRTAASGRRSSTVSSQGGLSWIAAASTERGRDGDPCVRGDHDTAASSASRASSTARTPAPVTAPVTAPAARSAREPPSRPSSRLSASSRRRATSAACGSGVGRLRIPAR